MKRIVVLCITIALTLSISMGLLMYSVGSSDEVDNILAEFNNLGNLVRRPTSVAEIERQHDALQDSNPTPGGGLPGGTTPPNPPGTTPNVGTDVNMWCEVVDSVHKDWGARGYTYTQNDNGDIRTDCSGFVSYCLYTAGFTNNKKQGTSASLPSFLQSLGWQNVTSVKDTGLQKGDIIAYSGHIEVFYSYSSSNYPRVWNWGGPASAQNKYTGVTDVSTVDSTGISGHYIGQITSAWRLPSN